MRFSRHEYWIGLHALLQRIFRYLITEDSCFLPPIPYNIIVILFTYPQAVITQLIFAIISLNRLLTVWSVNNKENILFYLHLSWSVFFVHHFINSSFHSLLACIASEEKSNMHFIFPTVLVSCFFFPGFYQDFLFVFGSLQVACDRPRCRCFVIYPPLYLSFLDLWLDIYHLGKFQSLLVLGFFLSFPHPLPPSFLILLLFLVLLFVLLLFHVIEHVIVPSPFLDFLFHFLFFLGISAFGSSF